jgi:hypothetical protein
MKTYPDGQVAVPPFGIINTIHTPDELPLEINYPNDSRNNFSD